MSKRRSIILSVVLEGRSQAETARRFEVSQGWVSRLVARYRVEGDAAFEPRSRRPKTSPTRTGEPMVQAIVELRDELTAQGLDGGPETIRWHLQRRGGGAPSVATIRRYLIQAGRVRPEPRKRPRSSYIGFEADLANETWQSDMTHWRIANSAEVELLTWLDDHSRYALSVTAHRRVNGLIVVETFTETAKTQGLAASVLSNNALYFTTRFAGGKGGRNHLETLLADLGIEQKHSRPNHPTTCGKVERFQQTLKKWLTAQPTATDIAELQAQLDTFVEIYNHDRPHRSLGRATPAVAYRRLPKAQRGQTNAAAHYRVRHDIVGEAGKVTLRYNGKLHHIGIGRPHKHTRVTLIIKDRDIAILNHQTGELLRHLTLDPTRNYQPQNTNKA